MMHRMAFRARRLGALLLMAAVMAACTSEADPGPNGDGENATTSSAPSPTSSVPVGTNYPLGDGQTRPELPVAETLTEDGSSFALSSVVRLADDRVVVSGVLTPANPVEVGANAEPGYTTIANGGDFSAVELTVEGDEVVYLPVRDDQGRCLCGAVRPGFEGEPLPVSVVVSAPKDASSVNLKVAPYGTFTDVEIAEPEPTPDAKTPFGLTQTLVVDALTRDQGRITARVRVQQPGPAKDSYVFGVYNPPLVAEQGSCLRSVMVVSGTRGGWVSDADCATGLMPGEDEQVALDLTIGDPGGDDLAVIPSDGAPIEGSAMQGSADVAEFAFRSRSDAATIAGGRSVKVELATEVLFDVDSATLTSTADSSLDATAAALKKQSARKVSVTGHTDSQGSESYNLELSQRRAEAVRDALRKRLGSGWTLSAEGLGETEPAAEEKGSPSAIKAAQQRNRRVEVTVTS